MKKITYTIDGFRMFEINGRIKVMELNYGTYFAVSYTDNNGINTKIKIPIGATQTESLINMRSEFDRIIKQYY